MNSVLDEVCIFVTHHHDAYIRVYNMEGKLVVTYTWKRIPDFKTYTPANLLYIPPMYLLVTGEKWKKWGHNAELILWCLDVQDFIHPLLVWTWKHPLEVNYYVGDYTISYAKEKIFVSSPAENVLSLQLMYNKMICSFSMSLFPSHVISILFHLLNFFFE